MDGTMKKWMLALGSFVVTAASVVAQVPNVQIDAYDGTGYQPCEPSLAISPVDPDVMVAGSILDNVYTSQDGGKTWTKDVLTSRYGVFGDPCVVASPRGDFYYLHLSDPEGAGWASESLLDRIVCQRSTDGGRSWSKGEAWAFLGRRIRTKNGPLFLQTTSEFTRVGPNLTATTAARQGTAP